MAKEPKEKEKDGGSGMVILFSALLALGAAYGVYYCYDEAGKAEVQLERSKDEYKKMGGWKKPVEDYLRKNKGRPAPSESNEDMMVFLDRKARESQIPSGTITFSKTPPINLTAWTETVYTATLTSKDPIKKAPIVDFVRKVETERKSTKVKTLQLVYSGDDFKSGTITFSQFTPK
jgi:hypothetical protein